MKKSNRLSKETSPYLLQHQYNPVDWYAWGEEAFEAARSQNKPIFLSIGYSTCYWCHMMEKDSFEREEVAQVLNEKFISIKVDREERPDVDQIYMDAVVGLTGHGGWPMSVFLTPDKKPFWGGTYFPRDRFIEILNRLADAWVTEHTAVIQSAQNITTTLEGRNIEPSSRPVSEEVLETAFNTFKQNFDSRFGGFGKAPKFPPSQQVRFLLKLYSRTKDTSALHIAEKTLSEMAYGGIFDHLEGGFHRYSTDEKWIVPHFEKMLYDTALLVPAYLDAYLITQKNDYALIAHDSLQYLIQHMKAPEGGFYAAEDAGEVHREGEFYVWNYSELKECLSQAQFEVLKKNFDIHEEGNFEGNSILTMHPECSWSEKHTGDLKDTLSVLVHIRSKRNRPARDDKILTSWNGLALSALAYAGRALSDSRFLNHAIDLAAYIYSTLRTQGILYHQLCRGKIGAKAFLDDYAHVIEGLLELYRSTFDERYLHWAKDLQNEQDATLWDAQAGLYNYSSAADILYRKKEIIDGATPSGNSVTLQNLLTLGEILSDESMVDKSRKILSALAQGLRSYPSAFSKALQAVEYILTPRRVLVVVGEEKLWRPELEKLYVPNIPILAHANPKMSELPIVSICAKPEYGARYYMCTNNACNIPKNSLSEILPDLVGSLNLK